MTKVFLTLCAFLLTQISFSQQDGEIYGLEFRTSELRLAKVDPANGQVNVISTQPTSADQFGSGISDLDPDGQRYFYVRFGQIITVDLVSGSVLNSPSISCATHQFNVVQPISNIAYNPIDGNIYGVLHYGSSLWFATVNPVTGVMDVLSSGPISGDMYQSGVSDLDPYTGRYFYVRNNMIYTVDINSATVVESHGIQNPNGAVTPFTNIAYDWLTDQLFGLEFIGGQWQGPAAELRLVTVDPTSGAHNILSSSVLSADMFQSGVSDIDPVKDQYYYIRANAILTVSLSTGALLDYKSLSNPNQAISPITNIEVVKDYQTTLPPTATFVPSTLEFEARFKNTSAYTLHSHWDFGDGTSSTERHPTHTYATPGTYTVTLTTESIDGRQEVITDVVEITGPTVGLSEEELPNVSVYPNPANDILTIEADADAWVTITDMNGRTVQELQVSAGFEKVQLAGLSSGIYQVLVRDESRVLLREKLVVAR